ncbi:hypothetical protein BDN70DRAFT_936873 [Pholiota conissans]|uniref:Uncharacterized protein n=1 Tax=Pholiota conissans TaxID=109636 RepID=A0A9P5YT00_9AGAR|nr:hypothetical protein BDN70DRAFT_936873 [Pholiota conissans]
MSALQNKATPKYKIGDRVRARTNVEGRLFYGTFKNALGNYVDEFVSIELERSLEVLEVKPVTKTTTLQVPRTSMSPADPSPSTTTTTTYVYRLGYMYGKEKERSVTAEVTPRVSKTVPHEDLRVNTVSINVAPQVFKAGDFVILIKEHKVTKNHEIERGKWAPKTTVFKQGERVMIVERATSRTGGKYDGLTSKYAFYEIVKFETKNYYDVFWKSTEYIDEALIKKDK